MDEVTIFGLNYFKEHYPAVLQERFKQMDLEQEAPEIIMEMTQKLGFRRITTVFTVCLSRMYAMVVWDAIPLIV